MRVWFVSELYYPEETSTGYLLTKLAEGLARSSSVSALCAQPTYSSRGVRSPRSEMRNGVEICRCWSTTFSKDFLLGRLLNMFTISVSIFVSALRRFSRDDVAIVVTNPPGLPYIVLAACRVRRAKYVLLVHDVYPDALYVAGLLRRGSIVARVVERVAAWPYRLADRVVVLGRDMEALIVRKGATASARIVRIPNWADADIITRADRRRNPLLIRLGLGDRWVLQYAGNMGRTHGLESVVEAARRVAAVARDVHLLFVGWGAKSAMLQQAAKASRGAMTVLGPMGRDEQQTFLNACDVALVCFGPGMSGVSVPSRMYNILAAGKPIIAVTNFDSELAYVIEEEGVGWLVPPGSPDLLAETILRARQRLAEDAEMPARARRAAEKYTLDRAVRAYEAVVRDLSEPELPVVATNTQPSPPSHPERDPAEDAESPTPATAWQTLEIRGEDAHGGERSIEYRSPS